MKQFAFLGVYSGEPYLERRPIELGDLVVVEKLGFNLGQVWYADVIEYIAKSGVEYKPASSKPSFRQEK